MADYRAIHATSTAIIDLLRSNYRREDFDNDLVFELYTSTDFDQPMAAGVSVFLYRVYANGSHRIPSGRLGPDGRRFQNQLPLELHYLLTAWSNDASLQHTIAGWMLRTVEDFPTLPAALLNQSVTGVFRPEETVSLGLCDLRTEDLLRIWETMVDKKFQLSVPYVARVVQIESRELMATGEPVQQRNLQIATHSAI